MKAFLPLHLSPCQAARGLQSSFSIQENHDENLSNHGCRFGGVGFLLSRACLAKLFIESDKELNEVYKALGKQINADVREDLKIIQREWMKYRDSVCQPESGTINVDCNYRVNRERTEYLRDRLRECKAGTCRPDMIAQQSW